MGLRINTNVSSISAMRSLSNTTNASQKVLGQLSSGSRIVTSADDAAGLAISEKLRATIRSVTQADRNANDGISLIQTAEGGMQEISNVLIRLRELSIQSASDTVGEGERKFSDLEFQSLKQEIQRISQSTEFNGKKLLNGEGESLDFQIGSNNIPDQDRVTYNPAMINASISNLKIDELAINDKEGARTSLDSIDGALNSVSGGRATLGALQNRLTSTSNGLQVLKENLSAANSRIRDTDYAEASAANAKNNILQQAGTSVLAQANSQGSAALRLVG